MTYILQSHNTFSIIYEYDDTKTSNLDTEFSDIGGTLFEYFRVAQNENSYP